MEKEPINLSNEFQDELIKWKSKRVVLNPDTN